MVHNLNFGGWHDPFYDRSAIRDPKRLIGRDQVFMTVFDLLQREQCVSIVGIRLIGKSSILQMLGNPEIQQRVGYTMQNFQFILINFADYPQKTQEGFFQDVCKQIIAHCQTQLEGFEFSSEDWFLHFRDLLQYISRKGLRIVLLFDSFDKVTLNEVFNLHFFSYLRNLAINNLVYYVTASMKPLAEVCHQEAKTSPFFSIFAPCPLHPLLPEEAEQLTTQFIKDSGRHFTPNEKFWIIEQAGRHPYFLQLTCSVLFQEKWSNGSRHYSMDKVFSRVESELTPIFSNIWEYIQEPHTDKLSEAKLSAEQHELLEEARRRSSPTRLRKIPELSESSLFRNYLCKKFKIDNPNFITLNDLKEVLSHINNITYLSTSRLAETLYVTQRFEREMNSSNEKKGKIVLDLINEAHALMKPESMRNDSSIEWRSYNILFYHYIKHHLKSEHICARLGIGNKRDFFRRQNDALAILLEKIHILETAALQED